MEKEGEAGAGGGGTGAGSGSSRPPVPPMSLYERQAVQALQALQRQPNAAAQYLQQMYAAQHQQLMLQQHLSNSQLQNLAVQQVTLAANRQTTSVSESGAATPSTVNLSTAVVTQAGLRTQVTTPPATSVLLTPPSPSLSPSQAKMYLQAQVVARTLTRTTPLTHQLILMPGTSVGSVQTELATGDTDQAQNLAVRGQGAVAKSSTVVVTQLTPAAVVPPPSPLSPPSTKAPPALNVDGEREEGGVKLTRSVTPSGHSLVSSASAYASLPPHSLLHQQLQQKHLVIQQQHLSLQRQTPAYPHPHQAHVPAHPHQSHPQTLVVQPLAQASAEASRPAPAPAPAHKLAQAHVEGLKQAQGQVEGYKQAQGQAEAYKQTQGQAEAYKQAHGQTEAYKQAPGQTELYKQPQGQAEAYKQAQDQTEAHKQAQGQTEAHKLAQSQTDAYKQAQGQTQAQSEAHKQAHAHIESLKLAQAPAEVYKQAQPEAFKQAQAQAHPEGPKQAQSQAEVQKVVPAHAEAPHQALGQGEAQRQTTPHGEAQRQPQRKAETQRQGEEQGEAQRGEAGALGKAPAGKGTAPVPGTVLQASASTQTPGSGLAGAAHQWGQHCGQSGCGLPPLPLKSAVLGVKRKAEDEDSDSGFAALGPPELSPSLCPPLDPKHPQTGRGDSGLPPPVLTSVSSLLKGGGRHGVDNKPPRAIVKPHILTHVIEGFVIQEGAEPFPVDITNNKQKLQEPPVLQPETQLPQTEPGPQTGGPEGPELLTCEFCGRLEHADKFKRSKRFCSMACAKRYNVSCRKVVRRFTGERGGPNPKEGGARLGRRSSRRESGDGGRGGSRRPGKGVDDGRVSDTSSFEDPLSPEVPPCQGETGGGGGSLESGFTGNSPSLWSVQQVHEFISTLPGCQDLAEDFQLQEIDGQALLLLKEEHLMTTMNMKLGPALKICARINLLKES